MEKSYSPKKFRRKIPKVGRSYEQYQNEKQSFDKSKDINDLVEELMLQKACDKIPGGLADDMEPDDFDQEELNAGIKVEMEHTSDKNIAREIAMDHLTEDPNYYKKLKKIHKSEVIMNDRFNINDFVEEELVKAKKLPEGTKRTYNGRDYIKQGGEWIPVKKVSGTTQKQESPTKKDEKVESYVNKYKSKFGNEGLLSSDAKEWFEGAGLNESQVKQALSSLKKESPVKKEDNPIKKEYSELSKLSRTALESEYQRFHQVSSVEGESKGSLIAGILRAKHGDKRVDEAFSLGKKETETKKEKTQPENKATSSVAKNDVLKVLSAMDLQDGTEDSQKIYGMLDKLVAKKEADISKDDILKVLSAMDLQDSTEDSQKVYSMLNKLLDKKISKSQELIMDIDKEIEQNAELMEKAFSAQIENTKKIIKSLSKEELQNVVSSLNVEQKQLFKSILEDMTKAIEMDKFYSGTKKKVELKNAVAGVDTGSDEDDEKLVLSEAAAHNHQGDATPEGFEGQIIKAKKDVEDKKEDKAKKKLVEAVDEVAEGEAKEAKEEHEKEMHKKDVKKSIEWKSENELLKANTLGRNHHFSVNEYYNQVLANSEEEMEKGRGPDKQKRKTQGSADNSRPVGGSEEDHKYMRSMAYKEYSDKVNSHGSEEKFKEKDPKGHKMITDSIDKYDKLLKKSNDINDLIELNLDESINDVLNKSIEIEDPKFTVKSFSEDDLFTSDELEKAKKCKEDEEKAKTKTKQVPMGVRG